MHPETKVVEAPIGIIFTTDSWQPAERSRQSHRCGGGVNMKFCISFEEQRLQTCSMSVAVRGDEPRGAWTPGCKH